MQIRRGRVDKSPAVGDRSGTEVHHAAAPRSKHLHEFNDNIAPRFFSSLFISPCCRLLILLCLRSLHLSLIAAHWVLPSSAMGRPNLNLLPSLLSLSSLIFAQETVLYPPEGLTVNDIDSMNVVFETSYSAVNLTVFCLEDTTNDYAFHAYDGNPRKSDNQLELDISKSALTHNGATVPPTGTAYLAPIDESIGLNWATTTAFQCHMLFGDPYTTSNSFNSGHFTMVSTGGSPTTWSLSSTTTSSSSSTSTSTSGKFLISRWPSNSICN